jgi:putative FmdB family regulatory protein
MPIFEYKCNECGWKDEYIESFSISKENFHPDICPNCKKGKMEKQFNADNQTFDVKGGSSYHGSGKKNWRKNKSISDQADILNGKKDPY